MMKECQNIKRAIEKSTKEFEEQMAKDRFNSLDELTKKLKVEPLWKVTKLSSKYLNQKILNLLDSFITLKKITFTCKN